MTAPSEPLAAGVAARADAFPLERLHAVVSGPEAAPPLLVLHGWGSSAALMAAAAAVVSDGFRVHTLDLPGHGLTPPPPEAWGVPEYAALVARYRALAEIHPAGDTPPLPRCKDPDDQKFLELALRCGADFLVSKDNALLRLKGRTRLPYAIVTPQAAADSLHPSLPD